MVFIATTHEYKVGLDKKLIRKRPYPVSKIPVLSLDILLVIYLQYKTS